LDEFLLFIEELFLLYNIGLLGYILRKQKILPEVTEKVLTAGILNVIFPTLILFGMYVSFSVEN
jgi:predicted permease